VGVELLPALMLVIAARIRGNQRRGSHNGSLRDGPPAWRCRSWRWMT